MRIIGGHDYYDSGLAMGQDETVLFKRNEDRHMSDLEMATRIQLPQVVCNGMLRGSAPARVQMRQIHWFRPSHEFASATQGRVRHEFQSATVILAGTVHHGLHAVARPTGGIQTTIDERWIWKAEALRAYAVDHGLEVVEGTAGTIKEWAYGQAAGSSRRQIEIETQDIDTWFTPHRLTGGAMEAMIAERITVASRNPTEFPMRDASGTTRPWAIDRATLGAMQFARAVDPYSAFQEISMWLGGVLPKPGAMPIEITDNRIKIAKAGFDHPTSFRRSKAQA
jgi:hypothetical protein